MAAFPTLPLHTDAYLADTRHLSTLEHGAFLLLLMCAWRTEGCRLADNDGFLARIVGLTPYRWRKVRTSLEPLFQISEGYWYNAKLTRTYTDVAARVARNREIGARGGKAAARKNAGKNTDKNPAIDKNRNKKNPCTQAKSLDSRTEVSAGAAQSKAKDKTKKREVAPEKHDTAVCGTPEFEKLVQAVRAAAGLDYIQEKDKALVVAWQALAASDGDTDRLLGIIHEVHDREQHRTGKAPKHLAYYDPIIRDRLPHRVPATEATKPHDKRRFDPASSADWVLYLGDAGSKFRGDWISANWGIGTQHPHFLAVSLGADPRHAVNPMIPADIYTTYAPAWRWVPRTPLDKNIKHP